MKYFKLKSTIFSLLSVLIVAVFLTSCGKEESLEQIETTNETLMVEEFSKTFVLPFGYDDLAQDEKDEYLNSLNPKTLSKLIESAEIEDYFGYLGKKDLLNSQAKHGDIFDDQTLSLLSESEINTFKSTDGSQLEARWPWDTSCGSWFNDGYHWICTNYYHGFCKNSACTLRQKKICNNSRDKYRYFYAPVRNCG